MTVVGLDTSVVVACLSSWHPRHAWAADVVDRCIASGARVVIPVHALVQAYSVLTRLPAMYRLAAPDALDLLHQTLVAQASILAEVRSPWSFLGDAVTAGVVGGGIHDFEILDAVAAAGATRLLTLDPDDYRRFGDRGVAIVAP